MAENPSDEIARLKEQREKIRAIPSFQTLMPITMTAEDFLKFLDARIELLEMQNPEVEPFVTRGELQSEGIFNANFKTRVTSTHNEWLKAQGLDEDRFGLPIPLFESLRHPQFIKIIVQRDEEAISNWRGWGMTRDEVG